MSKILASTVNNQSAAAYGKNPWHVLVLVLVVLRGPGISAKLGIKFYISGDMYIARWEDGTIYGRRSKRKS